VVHSCFDFHTLNSQEDIRHEIEIDAPAEVVFSKLVEPGELNRWIATTPPSSRKWAAP
jgi:uncharacterized protein YndB with AHSA1/START domain